MAKLDESFRDFELGGWEDESVCSDYDQHLSTVTIQSVGALLDAAGVRQGRRVLDVATGAGYAAAIAAERGAEAIGVDFSASQLNMARNRCHPRNGQSSSLTLMREKSTTRRLDSNKRMPTRCRFPLRASTQ